MQDRRGNYWNYTYDTQGNELTATDPLSYVVTNTYNSHNMLLTAASPNAAARALRLKLPLQITGQFDSAAAADVTCSL